MMKSLVAGRLVGKILALREDYARAARSKTDSRQANREAYIRQFYHYRGVGESGIKAANYIHIFMLLFKSAAEKTNYGKRDRNALQL